MRDLVGATHWARKTLESEIFFWKPDKWFKIWFCLVTLANYKNNKQFKRGEVLITYKEIMASTKATRDQVDKCLRYLKQANMCATRRTTRGIYVSLLNYDFYQTLDNYKSDTKSYVSSDKEATEKRQRSDTINKNEKNEKNINTIANNGENEMLSIFYRINPMLNFANKSERAAVTELYEKLGKEKAIATAEAAVAVYGKKYAPVITTPLELKKNLSKLVSFYSRENQSSQIVEL